jgi:hypothetical protein
MSEPLEYKIINWKLLTKRGRYEETVPNGYLYPDTNEILPDPLMKPFPYYPVLAILQIECSDGIPRKIIFVSMDPNYDEQAWLQPVIDVMTRETYVGSMLEGTMREVDHLTPMYDCLAGKSVSGDFAHNGNTFTYTKNASGSLLVLISRSPPSPPQMIDGKWRLPSDDGTATMATYWFPGTSPLPQDWRERVDEIDTRFYDLYIEATNTGEPQIFTYGDWSCCCEKTSYYSVNVTIDPIQTGVAWGWRICTYEPVNLDDERKQPAKRLQLITFGPGFGKTVEQPTAKIDGEDYVLGWFTEVCVRNTAGVSEPLIDRIFRIFWELHDGKLAFDKDQAEDHSVVSIIDGFVCTYMPDPFISDFTIRHQ